MKEEDFDCKFPQLYRGKNHGREVGTQKKAGAGESSTVLMGGDWLACGRGESLSALLFRVTWGLSGAYNSVMLRMVLPNN